ncbi:MAG: helix-turn-helix domain-containing protein [Firmicutes bacterium]|nr:helix-turn-helix domain-containing protein [Bacillota bacterium]
MHIFVERLTGLCQEKSITWIELSRATNISHATISNWVNGKRLPNIDSITMLTKYFGCTAGYLIGTED